MHIALIITYEHSTRLPFGWFLKSINLQSSKYASHPVILRGAEGGVAESIISRIILVHLEREPSQTMGEGRGRVLSEPSTKSRMWGRD